MSTLHDLKHPPSLRSPSSDQPSFWGVNLSNVPSPTTEMDITNDFKKYGEIYSVKRVTTDSGCCSINIVFKSPKKPNSISDIANQHLKYNVNALHASQLPSPSPSLQRFRLPVSKKSAVAKINLCPSSVTKPKPKFVSKLSRDAVPFTAPRAERLVHINTAKTTEEESVLFEVQCKSITYETTEEEVIEWMAQNLFGSLKDAVSEMTMLPGESMAVFELTDREAISRLTDIIRSKRDAQFNGHTFTLQRKSNDDAVAPGKGLSLQVEDSDRHEDTVTPLQSIGEDTQEDKSKLNFLLGMGFHHGLTKSGDDKKVEEEVQKNFYFQLPEEAKEYVAKQGSSLEIPKTAFVMQLSVLTTNGPIPIQHYRQWKQSNPSMTNVSSSTSMSSIKSTPCSRKTDITSNLDPESVRSKKSDTSTLVLQQSPVSDVVTPTPAVTALFGDSASSGNKRGSPLSNPLVNKKSSDNSNTKLTASTSSGSIKPPPVFKVGPGPLTKNASTGSITNLVNNVTTNNVSNGTNGTKKVSTNNTTNGTQNNNTTNGRMFQYPQTNSTTNLFGNGLPQIMNNMQSNGQVQVGVVPNSLQLISPRCSLINLNGVNGVNIQSPAPPPVVVPNGTDFNPMNQNVGTGFAMTTPIANLTPVHIPNLMNNTNNTGNQATSPIGNTGFRSPINYNINTPQSPIGNYTGITPIINAFTPTTNGLNAITPTTSLPFYWNNLNGQNANKLNTNNGGMNQMGINMENDPMAPHNMQNMLSNGAGGNTYVQNQLQKQGLLRPPMNQNGGHQNGSNQQNGGSPVGDSKPNTFFNYPVPTEDPRSSPSNGSNNVMNGGNNTMMNGGGINMMNGLNNQQSNQSYHGMNMMHDDGPDERQMDEPPSMEEINNMRSIPSVISPNGTTPVVMITNLNEDEIDCDKIFTLCGVFGDVQRVKISYHKRDTAFVQLANHRQAKHVVTSLNRMQLYGKMIHVNLSRMTRVKLPKDSPNSAMMFPDAKFLTKDYTNCKKHRYSKKGAGGIKYSPLSIGQPSHILHIANLPIQSEAKDLQVFLCGNSGANVSNGRYHHNNDKIQSIELIGVNNKLGSCQAFAKCHSVDMACQILIDYHSKEFLGREIKISFATRSHMPSDINKTHKTYSYTTTKKPGASINSIPSSIPRQSSGGAVANGVHQNSADSMSSGSSNGHSSGHNGHHSNGMSSHGGDRGSSSGGYGGFNGHSSHNGMEQNGYGGRGGYSRSFHSSHQVCHSNFPKHAIHSMRMNTRPRMPYNVR